MKIIEAVKSSARIVTNAGLALVGSILDKAGFHGMCNELPVAQAHPENQISCADIFATAVGTMCSGNSSYEASREYGADREFYQDALGIERIPSAERLRQRLDQAAAEEESRGYELHDKLRETNVAILKASGASLTSLPMGDVPVDCDVTPYDESKSHKEGVSRTYKGFDGYSPMDAHAGTEGWFVNTEFRKGSQHSQKGTPKFLIETIDICNKLTDKTLLFRLDSGNDAADNIGVIMERGHHFIIKRNLWQESKDGWLELAKGNAPIHETPRDGKDAKVSVIRIVFEVTARTIDKHGQVLLLPDIDVNTWWDNTGLPDRDVIELYHQHGTMEQYHSELKTDMNMERLPSGKFSTNRLVHELSMLAYNVLRRIGCALSEAPAAPMRGKAFRRRLGTVITHVVQTPARIVRHSRTLKMDLGCSNAWADTFIWLQRKLCEA